MFENGKNLYTFPLKFVFNARRIHWRVSELSIQRAGYCRIFAILLLL